MTVLNMSTPVFLFSISVKETIAYFQTQIEMALGCDSVNSYGSQNWLMVIWVLPMCRNVQIRPCWGLLRCEISLITQNTSFVTTE